jgi:hypothetical protein
MKITLGTNQAVNMLTDDKYSSWSREGAEIIVQYLEGMERDSGDEIEFDAVSIRCDFHEYSTLEELVGDYPELADKEEEEILRQLMHWGIYIGQTSEGVVVRNQ